MNFLRQDFQKLSSERQTDRQTQPKLYTKPFRDISLALEFGLSLGIGLASPSAFKEW